MPNDDRLEPVSQLEQAIQAIQSGDRKRGRLLLSQVLKADPKEAQAWLWLAACWDEPDKKRYCLEQALALRPDDPHIRQALEQLPAASGSTPVSPDDLPPQEIEAPPTTDEAAAGAAAAPVESGDAPAAPAQKKKKPQPKPVSKKGNSTLEGCLLIFLGLILFAAVFLLFFVLIQSNVLTIPGLAPTPLPPAPPGELPVYQLPATWTPTPDLEALPSPTLAPQSTVTGLPSATLPPSITPITPSFDQWRILIGQSVEERPLEVFRFGLGSREKMIIAGMHGTLDGDSVSLADQMIAHLQANPRLVPEDTTLYILRLLNPDAMAVSVRLNANGVDLNRNFAQNWQSSWEGASCLTSDPASAGSTPLSELETQAVTKFLSARSVEALINYRSGGQGAYPAGGGADPRSIALAQAIAGISGFDYPPLEEDCEYTGTLVDWALSRGALAAVDLAPAGEQALDFETNLEILSLLLAWDAANATPVASTSTPTPAITGTITLPQTALPTETTTATLQPTASPTTTATTSPTP